MNGKVDWSSLAISSVGSAVGQGLAGYLAAGSTAAPQAGMANTNGEGIPQQSASGVPSFAESVASRQSNPFGLPLRNNKGTVETQDSIDYLRLLEARGVDTAANVSDNITNAAQTPGSTSVSASFYANALQGRLIPTTVIHGTRWTEDQKIAFDVVERMAYEAQHQPEPPKEQPTFTVMGDYAGSVATTPSNSPVMSYGQQMEHVDMVMVGVGKGVFNGFTKLAMETLNTLGKWSIMASLQDIGVDPYKSGEVATKITSKWKTGEIFSYDNVE